MNGPFDALGCGRSYLKTASLRQVLKSTAALLVWLGRYQQEPVDLTAERILVMFEREIDGFRKGHGEAQEPIQMLVGHPWQRFLTARADAIDWLSGEFADGVIADQLSMDEEQVRLIRTKALPLDGGVS